MPYFKVITTKGEVMWINAVVVFYVTSYKGRYRIFFDDGMCCDAVEICEATLEEFLHSLTEK